MHNLNYLTLEVVWKELFVTLVINQRCILLLRLTVFVDHRYNTGHFSGRRTSITKFSTAAVLEEPITPPVQVEHTKLLINGQFVDAASGIYVFSYIESETLTRSFVNNMLNNRY